MHIAIATLICKVIIIIYLYIGPPTVYLSNVTVSYESGKASLNCNATNDTDAVNPLQIEWYYPNGSLIISDKRKIFLDFVKVNNQLRSTLILVLLSRSDSGNYTCQAIHDLQSYTKATTNLIVQCKLAICY